ncbi:cyclic AMP-dependent transcription factor ATF-3-like [Dendronephthya gigantea]|uniref:cyclic AMP-dependent transcription factor ATF-3-like n=1 Tax=Dendronephthya gigantea TaxID=151771 RepID=UPI00106C007A|nr:cyclic AMP-dependent transcription factor ATF-3-like [Dendronephthya gigantea]
MDPFHIFTQPTGNLNNHGIQLPYLGPLPTVSAPEVELEETAEIPVKLGLRFAIESRRFANGLDIPEIETKPVKTEVDLTDEQAEKRKMRRERNKIAASKCRLKRKAQASKLEQSSKELETANHDLEVLINDLKREKSSLEAMLGKHKCLLKTPLEETREH